VKARRKLPERNKHVFLEFLESRAILSGDPLPVINPIAAVSIEAGQTGTFAATVAPQDGGVAPNVTWSLDSGSPGGSIDPKTGVYSWLPPIAQNIYMIPIRATETANPVLSSELEVTLMVFLVPAQVNSGANATVPASVMFSRTGGFTDPNPDTWTATAAYGDGSPVEPLEITAANTFQLSHTYTTPGVYDVQVQVKDSEGFSGYGIFSVTVTAPPLVSGVDYLVGGGKWASNIITYSFVPDGTQWDHGITNLFAAFDAKFGAGAWEPQVARALSTWGAAANVAFVQVADNGAPWNSPGLPQGDPRFGDIRFAGYSFPGDSTTLARTYFPDGSTTAGGDDEINTSMSFEIGSDYDLYSVMLHETGLALGLGEVSNPKEVMNQYYHGVLSGLQPGDIYGIQQIYGAAIPGGPASAMGQNGTRATTKEADASVAAIGSIQLPPVAPAPAAASAAQPGVANIHRYRLVLERVGHHWKWVQVVSKTIARISKAKVNYG
jgi:hypothetical protein